MSVKTYIKRDHGLFIAGRVLTIISFIQSLVVLAFIAISFFVLAGVWQAIPDFVDEVPTDVFNIVSLGFIISGALCLIFIIPIAIVGKIALTRIKNAQTKEDLLPWAIVVTIIINVIPGILLILASTLPSCRKEIEIDD